MDPPEKGDTYAQTPSAEREISMISTGIVLIKKALSRDQQIWLAKYALKTGHVNDPENVEKDGLSFWTMKNGQRIFNSGKSYFPFSFFLFVVFGSFSPLSFSCFS